MSLKIRLSRGGAKKRPFYRIVVADSRSPRDGRFIERLGYFDPLKAKDSDQRLKFDTERMTYWLGKGARPTDRVARFLSEADLFPKQERNNPIKGRLRKKAAERLKAAEEAAAAPAAQAEAPAEEAAAAAPGTEAEAAPQEAASEEAEAETAAEETEAEAAAEEAAAETADDGASDEDEKA